MKKIFIVDDNKTNLKILNLILTKSGYQVIEEQSPTTVFSNILKEEPDLILLDINMPEISGYELCEALKTTELTKKIPVIFISAQTDAKSIVRGFDLGAVDYITKPYNAQEVKARVATHLKIRELQSELENVNAGLEKKIQQQVKQISDTQMETIFSLAKLAQSRDDDTGEHLKRVQKYCYVLSKKLAENPNYRNLIDINFVRNIVNASPLHDIGKVGIADSILLKPGKLTPEEFEIMKTHTTIGANTLQDVHKKFGENKFIEMGVIIARFHHERFDGTGYPDGLKGLGIPLPARIMALADVYDALSTKRVYKEAFSQEKCIQIIKKGIGTQFDPAIVNAFLELTNQFEKIKNSGCKK